jgi:hypothetical protein
MFNVCPQCGQYSDEKTIDPQGPFAICPFCHHPHRFVQLPLFVVTGASGAGKSTIGLNLVRTFDRCVTMDNDMLWGAVPWSQGDDHRGYHNTWLRVAKNIGQSGRPVVLLGTALPEHFEPCPERRYFAQTHYLGVVADDTVLAERLRGRPNWRGSGTPAVVADMLRFNEYLKTNARTLSPPLSLLDTTAMTVAESTRAAVEWISAWLPP